MEYLTLPAILLVLWFIMSKRTKKSLGALIEVSAESSVKHLKQTSTTALVNNLADVSEDFKDRGIEFAEITAFAAALEDFDIVSTTTKARAKTASTADTES